MLICASTSAIGRAVGLGVAVARTVAVGALEAVAFAGVAAAALGDDEDVNTRSGAASHATNMTASNAARALILSG
jgi:hypothetical protein